MTSSADGSATRRRGPRGDGRDTREAILTAAGEEFAEKGFARATVRSIAGRAGVDPAMINHYFGGKVGLFREVTAMPVDPTVGLESALSGPRDELGLRVARHILGIWEDPRFREPMLALVRSALSDPNWMRPLREFVQTQLLPRLAEQARGSDPQRQAALAATHVAGVVVGRHVLGVATLTRPPLEELAQQLAPAVQAYLDDER